MNDQRNMILAILLSALVLIGGGWLAEKFYPQPKVKPPIASSASGTPSTASTGATPPASLPQTQVRDLAGALKSGPRILIETPKVRGSIALQGAVVDDLVLLKHQTVHGKNASPIRLFSPSGTKMAHFAGFGWTGEGMNAPTATTLWTADGGKLTPATPVTLRWSNGQQDFAIKYTVDDDYMFGVEQSVINRAAGAVGARPNGFVSRSYGALGQSSALSAPGHDVDGWTMHVGPIGTFNGTTDYDIDYSTLDEAGANGTRFNGKGSWLGFGDSYWLSALAPARAATADAGFRKVGNAYLADYAEANTILAPGKSLTTKSNLFAGAKEVEKLDGYEKQLGLTGFGKAIDWGWFEILAKPMFYLLNFLFKMVGNFGVAIILLTLIVKTIMFPIAQRQFASMAKMRVVQPKLKALQERFKDDKVKLQQEMMALYQKEKINPAGGCLPIFIQIPIFYALYKVLLLSIEMRHQPFVLWIKDLSAPDPLTPINLFGLLNFQPPAMIALGVLPILLGITMWLQFKLNPQSPDPIQQQVFSIMPWFLMFVMAPFAAGLQLYWVVNNTLTILQQKWLYRKYPMTPTEPAKS